MGTMPQTARGIDSGHSVQFLSALFAPQDLVLVRPIETWSEGGKRSRVDYPGIVYLRAGTKGQNGEWGHAGKLLCIRLSTILKRAESERTNITFGVCPRVGGEGQYDHAWQIRTVRCLWADIDDLKPPESLDRCQSSGLPVPSIVVSSGHGTHLYWVLSEPFLVDDCDDPLPVFGEFRQTENGKREHRSFFLDRDSKEKVYLDSRQNVPSVSSKGRHIQDILAGIASRIGGDCTHDLSRTLRIPGTWNRKNERNGHNPIPCELMECNALRYPISEFEPLATALPDRQRRERIAKIPLKSVDRITRKQEDKLRELLAACAIADEGERSEADFALCCWAVEQGISRSEIWNQSNAIGKFAESGEKYFCRTWEAAEGHTREKFYERIKRKPGKATTEAEPSEVTGETTVPPESVTSGEDNESVRARFHEDVAVDRAICESLKMDVLGELPDRKIKIFSETYGKNVTIESVSRLTYPDLLQMFGSIIREKVTCSEEENDMPDTYRLSHVREAIAIVAGSERAGYGIELGQGVWMGGRGKIVLVGPGHACVWDGTSLETVRKPRVAGLKVDMDFPSSDHWFDSAKLAEYLVKASDREWVDQTIDETIGIFEKWFWRGNIEVTAELITGLILATWVQSVWNWRPMVSITGASDSGKTLLFETLETIFGRLSLLNSKSTEAGIRQAVGSHSKVILCDEFESDRHRKQILEFFRTSSKGSKTLRGTTGQNSREYGLRHICWVTAVEVGMSRAPDRNRFIPLELTPPPKEKRGKIELPSESALQDLGQRLLAIAVRHCVAADELARKIKSQVFPKIHGRVIESFAVPVGILAASLGKSEPEAVDLMWGILSQLETDPAQATKDEIDLVGAILSSCVDIGRGERMTVSQLLNSPDDSSGKWECLERVGISAVGERTRITPRDTGFIYRGLFIAHAPVLRYLLKGTQWEDQSIDQLLKRLPDAKKCQQRVGGHRPWGVEIPWKYMQEKFLKEVSETENPENEENTENQEF